MLGAAELVLSTALSMPVVVFLAVDFWLICPGIRRSACRLAPQSRGTRVILIRDEIFTKERRLCPGGRNVRMPAVVSVVAVLAGGGPAGIIGAVKAVPAAGALRHPLHEVTFRPLDGT